MVFPFFYETILFRNGEIPLLDLHYNRIYNSAKLIDKSISFNLEELKLKILEAVNRKKSWARIRLEFHVVLEKFELKSIDVTDFSEIEFCNENPVSLCVFHEDFKSREILMNCKVANRLLYSTSIAFAQSRGFSQSIILNEKNQIVESSICNIFLIKNGQIYTPPLISGGVSGIMRSLIIESFGAIEQEIALESLDEFEEIFLTNALRGILLVNRVEDRLLNYQFSNELRKKIVEKFKSN